MGQDRKRQRRKPYGANGPLHRWVMLYHWLLNSPAWQSLGLAARCLLIEVWKRHNGLNNGEISFSIREAAGSLKIAPNTANKAFHELEDKGFLKARQRGAFSLKSRHATTWQITAEPCGGQEASKEFMRWSLPSTQGPKIRKPASTVATDSINGCHRAPATRAGKTVDGINGCDREGLHPSPHSLTH
jgi:hypothetical protein